MPDKKLTDNEIIKALECCSEPYCNDNQCPLHKNTINTKDCITQLSTNALDLINRLEGENKKNETIIRFADKTIESLKAEVERLKANEEMAEGYADALVEMTKTEAYKEFAERLREKTKWLFSSVSINNEIDNLLNELVGDGDGKRKD